MGRRMKPVPLARRGADEAELEALRVTAARRWWAALVAGQVYLPKTHLCGSCGLLVFAEDA
jgi:hypothetical protein